MKTKDLTNWNNYKETKEAKKIIKIFEEGSMNVGVGQGDLGVPIPIIGADGLFFVVGIVGHAVGLHDVEAAVAVEVAESRTPAEPPFVEGVAAGSFVFEHGGIGLATLAVVHRSFGKNFSIG